MTTPLAYSPQMVGKAAPSSSFQMGSPSQSAKKMILMPAASNLPSKDSPFFQTASVPIPPPMPSDEDLNKHYLIPAAPPMPREGELNKHYLSRDKTVENAKASLSSTATFITEVAQDLTFMATQGMKPSSSSSSIPIPPPMPSDEDLNKHYLIPAAPPMPTEADLNKNYLARDKTVENAKGFFSSTLNYMSEVAHELVEDAKYYAPSILHVSSSSSTPSGVIPVPPPMPTRENLHKHYLIPLAPPMPTREAMNKHYLSRNKALENTGNMLRSAATYVNEVAHELADPNYGRRVPVPPPMPSDEDLHKHYLIPLAPPMPTDEDLNKHYLSRNKTLENTGSMIKSAANYVSEMTHELVEDAKFYAPSLSTRSTQAGVIPVPPPMPSDEATHKHYLIPAAPPMPKRQATDKHYLSRDKTVENAGSMIQSAANYVSEVAQELVEDVKYYAPSLSRSSGGIPIPPPMPSDEDLNKHYLIPLAPPMPTKEAMNKHYLSRNKTLENASMNIKSAANYVGEVMSDAKQYAASISTPVPSILKNEQQWRSIPNPPPMPSDEDLHKHYLIPLAPPMPTREAMNKHYLSRDKTVENTGNMLRSAANYVSEVAHELVEDVKYYAPTLSKSSGGIPVPPPMPSEEDFHGHYLIPLAPPMPTREDLHKHYLIPLAPPMPTKEAMNKHYLSRNKTLENTGNMLRSAANYVVEVAHELADPNHGRRVPIPPPMPSDEDFNKHYLIPLAPPMPTKEAMNKHYLSRNKTLENASMNIKSAANYVGEVASDAVKSLQDANPFTSAQIPVPPPLPTKEDLNRHYLTKKVTRPSKKYSKSATPVQSAAPKKAGVFSSLLNFAGNLVGKVENMASIHDRSLFSSSIPVPPPMPTKESTHKHYLIPLAPPMPTEEQTNQHYLSRDKSLEKTGSLLHNAAVFMREVVADVGEYITDSPYELRPDEIPFPPPLPTRESTHKHFLSRDKKVENAQSYLMKAAHIAAEFVEDATGYVAIKGKQTYEALPTSAELSYVAGEAKEAVVEKTMNAVETVEHTVEASVENVKESVVHAKEVVVEKAVELKEAILPTPVVEKKAFHVPYPRYEVIDESSIFKAKPKTFYNRRILPRSSQDQRGDLSEVQMKMAQTMESLQIPSVFEYAGNQCYLPQQRKQMEDEQWNKIQSAF